MTAGRPRTRVAVVFGGRSSEHSISCLSAGNVIAELDPARYEVQAIGIRRDGAWCPASTDASAWSATDDGLPQVDGAESDPMTLLGACDVAFPVLHGRYGEDGTIQGLFEVLGVPYVGCGVLASAAAMDKPVAKRLMRDAGLPVGAFVEVHATDWREDPRGMAERIRGEVWPAFVKPARAGSSVGISRVAHEAELPNALALAFAHDARVIVEAEVPGAREIEVGVLESEPSAPLRASVPAEIFVDPKHAFYDFEAKYLDGSSTVVIPADVSPGLAERLAELAMAAFRALDCAGLARVDFLVQSDNAITANELNTMPGFTRNSAFPRMWQKTGMTYPELLDTLVRRAQIGAAR